MSDYKFIKFKTSDGSAVITLSRPDVYNALNDEITFELQDALKQCRNNDDVRVITLTGEGKAFCSGQDLKAASVTENRSFSESLHKRYNPIIRGIREIPKPVICKLNGVAAGAGCSLALACDLIVADEEAQLIEVFINIGLVLDSGSSYFLPRLVSYSKAFELATMGSRLRAGEAVEIGIVTRAVPADQLEAAWREMVEYYKGAPTKAIGLIKKMLNKSLSSTLDEMLEYEAYCQDIAGNTDDYKEGVRAFLEKRKATYTGS